VVKVHHAEEILQVLDCKRAWGGHGGIHLRREWNRPILGDVMSKKIDGGPAELALGYNQAMLAEPLEKIPVVGVLSFPARWGRQILDDRVVVRCCCVVALAVIAAWVPLTTTDLQALVGCEAYGLSE